MSPVAKPITDISGEIYSFFIISTSYRKIGHDPRVIRTVYLFIVERGLKGKRRSARSGYVVNASGRIGLTCPLVPRARAVYLLRTRRLSINASGVRKEALVYSGIIILVKVAGCDNSSSARRLLSVYKCRKLCLLRLCNRIFAPMSAYEGKGLSGSRNGKVSPCNALTEVVVSLCIMNYTGFTNG